MPPDRARDVALIVTPQYLPFLGGMERECALLSEELAGRGYRPVIVTEQLGLDTPLEEDDEHRAHVHRIPSSPERTLRVQLAAAARMARIVLRYRREAAFAIVRTATLPALLVGLLKRLRLLRIPTLVTAETGGVADDVVALADRPLFPVSRALVSSHDVLNGLCQANVDHLREHGFPEAKISSIPNGIDTSAWNTTAPPQRVERFLFLGRLDPAKGLFELLDAFRAVLDTHPHVRLTIAGEGPARADVERRIAALGLGEAVELAGLVPYERLGELFDSIDCVVLPSYSEGMPLSVLEAAAHRRVLIVSDVGDIPKLFGDRIRIVPPRDAGTLRDAMLAAVEDESPDADYEAVVERVAIGTVADAMLERLRISPPPR